MHECPGCCFLVCCIHLFSSVIESFALFTLNWLKLTLDDNRVMRHGVLAIPGATKVARVEENCKFVELTNAEAAELQEAVDYTAVAGERYPEAAQKHLNQ